jgi:hypothetical protein
MERAHVHSLRVSAVGELARLASIQGNTLLNPDFSLNREAANELFRSFDMDGNGTLDASEVKGLIRGLFWNVKGLEYNETDSFMSLFQELDGDGSGTVSCLYFHPLLLYSHPVFHPFQALSLPFQQMAESVSSFVPWSLNTKRCGCHHSVAHPWINPCETTSKWKTLFVGRLDVA